MLYMKNHIAFTRFKSSALTDPFVKEEYEKLQPTFELISALIEARTKLGISQAMLAEKISTRQSAISRLESGRGNPSVLFLQKIAGALGAKLQIRFIFPQ